MITRNLILFSLILTLSVFSFNCGIIGKRYEKKETSVYRINTNGKNKIKLINAAGNIKVTKSDTAAILIVNIEKSGKVRKKNLDKPLENLKVTIDSSSDVITITGEKQKTNGFSFSFGTGRNTIDFELKIPENIKVDISNTNGKADLSNVGNEMEVSIVNGSQTFNNLYGNVSLDVNNGNINGTVDSSTGMRLRANNGSIILTIDTLYKGSVEAEVVNGKITREGLNFNQVTDEKKKFLGVLGSSSNEIYLEVINGKIKLQGK
jgi:hypothetical protein